MERDYDGDMLDEEKLIRDILNGDVRAYENLLMRYQGLISSIITRMISSAEIREELAQDVYLAIYRRLENFEHRSSLATWIGRITYHKCVDYYKKQKAHLKNVSLDEVVNTETWKVAKDSPSGILMRKERAELIMKKIELLPAQYRLVLRLYHFDEMSYKEIGEVLKMPTGTVKNYLFRARKILKDELQTLYEKGIINLNGPTGGEGDIRGFSVYNVATIEQALEYAKADPMVKAGRLMVEAHPWWLAKGRTPKMPLK